MTGIVGVLIVLVVMLVGLVITRIATVALVFSGLSFDLARFQARSAFTGTGFTTAESESISQHPVRRRIIMLLMLLGNGIVVMLISSLLPVFLGAESGGRGIAARLLMLGCGLALLWAFASSKWVDRKMSKFIAWTLRRFTSIEVHDLTGLLHFTEGYAITNLKVRDSDWVRGKSLIQLRLSAEGIQVLGIVRRNGQYIGTPTGHTYIRLGDTLILYGRRKQLEELDARRANAQGDRQHEQRVDEQQAVIVEQQLRDEQARHDVESDVTSAEDTELVSR